MFAVVDVETTGGHASAHGMTEIAIVVTDGNSIIQEYSTLLKPNTTIPLNIQVLTGISNEMVANAPCFADKAGEIREILADHIFVAHHVNFDYAFVNKAFSECGINYNPKRLCSVRYTRRIKPGLNSYSLRNLCKDFNVINAAAHRAWGDARATTEILHLLLQSDVNILWKQLVKKNSGEFNLPAHLPSSDYQRLPERAGVYYFLDRTGKPLYIGKAVNLKKRVTSHFTGKSQTARSQAFKREIYNISFEETGSELLAILLEDHEIRHHWPRYNRAQKNPKKRFGVFSYRDQRGNSALAVNRINGQQGFLMEFFTYNEALLWLRKMVEKFNLNPASCGIPSLLMNEVDIEDHNRSFAAMLKDLQQPKGHYIIRTKGRCEEEDGFAYVENGRFSGIGFVPREDELSHPTQVENYLRKLNSSITTHALINKVMGNGEYQTMTLRQ